MAQAAARRAALALFVSSDRFLVRAFAYPTRAIVAA